MIQQGTILNIEEETLGSDLTADVSPGATVLHVASTVDFSDQGGEIFLGVSGGTGELLTYSEGSVDDTALTVTPDNPVSGSYTTETDFVYVSPLVKRFWAHVQLDGDDDEAVIAEISHPMAAMLEQGIRDVNNQETSAVLEETDGTWTVKDLLGLDPVIVGTAIFIPDTAAPFFEVDSEGHLTASSAVFEPDSDTAVPLTIFDSLFTGGKWTVWKDQSGVTQAYVSNGAAMFAQGFATGGDIASGVTSPTDTNFKRALSELYDGIVLGSGAAAPDILIQRTGATEVAFINPLANPVVVVIDRSLDLIARDTAPAAPGAGRLRIYAVKDGSGHPQARVKNSDGTTKALTATDFIDGS